MERLVPQLSATCGAQVLVRNVTVFKPLKNED